MGAKKSSVKKKKTKEKKRVACTQKYREGRDRDEEGGNNR